MYIVLASYADVKINYPADLKWLVSRRRRRFKRSLLLFPRTNTESPSTRRSRFRTLFRNEADALRRENNRENETRARARIFGNDGQKFETSAVVWRVRKREERSP